MIYSKLFLAPPTSKVNLSSKIKLPYFILTVLNSKFIIMNETLFVKIYINLFL
nr:MAG TPA: hypothetical protein [Caudoviricetes sp.]